MYWAQFLTVAMVHLLAVASPGPDFAMVIRQSVKGGRKQGMLCALGIASGIAVHMLYCVMGIGLLLSQSSAMLLALKTVAALYLGYIGIKGVLAKPTVGCDLQNTPLPSKQAYVSGFLTNGLNPKATLFFVALFGAVIEPTTPISIQTCYAIYLIVATGLWFCLMAYFFSANTIRLWFIRVGHWFDRCMGAILIMLAIQLLISVGYFS